MTHASPPSRSRTPHRAGRLRRAIAVGIGLALPAGALAAAPTASANPAGTGVVINEVYGGGGNSGAVYSHDFIELYNPTTSPVNLTGTLLQYRSTGGNTGGRLALTGTVPAGGYFLVQGAAGANPDLPALPTPDATSTMNLGGSGGQVLLVNGTADFTGSGDLAGNAGLIDMIGWGASSSFEKAPAPGTGNATSSARKSAGVDTDDNSADFATGAPTPTNAGSQPEPEPEQPEPGEEPVVTIAEIQGTGSATPLPATPVRTRGVVTAVYPTGGFNGFYLQTEGTGGAAKTAPAASDAVFVYGGSSGFATYPAIGDHVEVVGTPGEFNNMTQLNASAGSVERLEEAAEAVKARTFALPATDAEREMYEGELVAPTGPFTVSNNYNLNNFGELGLAAGETPLITPTELVKASDADGIAAAKADNAARSVALDDGSSIDFLGNATRPGRKDIPLPWITKDRTVRVNAGVTFTEPVIFDYRNNTWKFQPTTHLTAEGTPPATFEDTRTPAPEDVGGDLQVATFNVLNYFSTTGEAWAAGGSGRSCTYYTDRAGERVTNNRCDPNGPRGAANDTNLKRQQDKIVAAINAIDADVVSLEEIENSAAFGIERDTALATLVEALNADAGAGHWAFVPSPAAVPAAEDVIRTAFIYQPASVETVGESVILDDPSVFFNAREPLAQAFKAAGADDDEAFAMIVNHFKSKSTSGAPSSGDNANGDQGAWNGDRVRQATALAAFTEEFAAEAGTEAVFLTGDFNSYTQEDPLQVLYDEGFTNLGSDGEWSYAFDGMVGSLDHVLANEAAAALVTGSDIWEINAVEPISYEYSRYNYNATDFYRADPYRSSDHEPHVVGIAVGADVEPAPAEIAIEADPIRYGLAGRVSVQVGPEGATGEVTLRAGERTVGTFPVRDGVASGVIAARALAPGNYRLTASYSGDEQVAPGSAAVVLRVLKAQSSLATSVSSPVRAGRPGRVAVRVYSTGTSVPSGLVELRIGSYRTVARVSEGRAVLNLPTFATAGTRQVTVQYRGSGTVGQAAVRVPVRVVR